MDSVIERCIELAKGNTNVDVLWLYGSRTKGTAQLTSDYDLAVAFHDWPADIWQRRLQSEMLALDWMETLSLPEKALSVVDINLAPLPLAYNIIQTGQVLFAKDGLRLASEENRITSMWELDYLYHRQHYG
ncbi:nucleotidyltransferase domain-containing protein [Vreelandella aquamarina]|uniref:type VII toxin-antitoxin system MntA family adenylyltransferase antitoxin n=1 Tax=Vreelandella aquamarina TaxID=77097 RepID=UPI00384D4A8F